MATKTTATRSVSVLTGMAPVSGKTVTDVIVTQHGSTIAVEIVYSTGSSFVKFKQGVIDAGGTLDFGTGTIV